MQHLGEAVFIPAGCPHQVRNIQVTNWLTVPPSMSQVNLVSTVGHLKCY